LSNNFIAGQNMERDQFVCKYCEEVIRYERPIFCPHCGKKIDPSEGLTEISDDVEIYSWSRLGPSLMYLFLGWLAFVIPITFFWGRNGFVFLSVFWVICLGLVFIEYFISRSASPKENSK